MARKCPECGSNDVEIVGAGAYGDLVEAVCKKCEYDLEVEPDGFDEGGMEWVEAKIKEEENNGKNI